MNEIKTGDVVTLKSGGLKMTVMSINENEAVCAWDDKIKGGLIMETFPIIMIKKFQVDIRIIRL